MLDALTKSIVLDEEAFAKASSDFEDLSQKINSLRKDIESMLDDLQRGFDSPAGRKFMDSCRNNLIKPMEEQKIVVDHISETLRKCTDAYRSVFDEYREVVSFINS
ncbi:MAG: hypothetical protein K6B74_05440 [Ruminococcus sp.]|jgi:uncharacterized protein YukE|nr:hypothetical protein [Ruminococcus sp.]